MHGFYSFLKRLTRNDCTYLAHRLLMRAVYGNKLQLLANRDMFHRPEWFWGSRPIPAFPVSRPASTDGLNLEGKRQLVKDLLRSFEEAQKLDKDNESYSPLWKTQIERSATDFVEALFRKDIDFATRFLEEMFTQPALWGIGYGDFGVWQGAKFGSFVVLHQLIGLAESLGVVRMECPEQGEIAYAFDHGIEAVVERVEHAVGVKLDFPKISAAYGLNIAGRLIDMQTPGHVYAAFRLRTNLAKYFPRQASSILEIGAGFGGSAYWYLKQVPDSRYSILDLALTNVYQGWFLCNALGREDVLLFSDVLDGVPVGSRRVSIMPTRSEPHFNKLRFDAVFNQDSFPEMTEETVDDYLRFIRPRLDGILYSFNHESFSLVKGEPQTWLSERIMKSGGFERLARELSWVRRGYVEEVYRVKQ